MQGAALLQPGLPQGALARGAQGGVPPQEGQMSRAPEPRVSAPADQHLALLAPCMMSGQVFSLDTRTPCCLGMGRVSALFIRVCTVDGRLPDEHRGHEVLPGAPSNANGTVHPSSPVYPPLCTPSACVARVCTTLQPCRSRRMVRLCLSVCPDLPLIVRRAGVMHRERTAHSHCYAIDQQYPPVCLLALGPMPCCPALTHGTRVRPRTHAAPYPGTHASSGCQPHCRGIRTRPPHCTSTSSPAVFNVTHCLHWGCSSSPSVRVGRHNCCWRVH